VTSVHDELQHLDFSRGELVERGCQGRIRGCAQAAMVSRRRAAFCRPSAPPVVRHFRTPVRQGRATRRAPMY